MQNKYYKIYAKQILNLTTLYLNGLRMVIFWPQEHCENGVKIRYPRFLTGAWISKKEQEYSTLMEYHLLSLRMKYIGRDVQYLIKFKKIRVSLLHLQ